MLLVVVRLILRFLTFCFISIFLLFLSRFIAVRHLLVQNRSLWLLAFKHRHWFSEMVAPCSRFRLFIFNCNDFCKLSWKRSCETITFDFCSLPPKCVMCSSFVFIPAFSHSLSPSYSFFACYRCSLLLPSCNAVVVYCCCFHLSLPMLFFYFALLLWFAILGNNHSMGSSNISTECVHNKPTHRFFPFFATNKHTICVRAGKTQWNEKQAKTARQNVMFKKKNLKAINDAEKLMRMSQGWDSCKKIRLLFLS